MTYCSNNGKYQEQAKELEKLIPISGRCAESYLELFRIAGNAYYDIYNNGGCNSHRFKVLYDEIIDNRIAGDCKISESEDFTKDDWFELKEFLYFDATQEDRDFYLFEWENNEPETEYQKKMLDIFERFMDWVVITTYEKYKSLN